MALKTLVKVGNITNLSDARYCAGMGVDFLGFNVVEGQENYISPKQFQEIRGWVTGPQIVAQVHGLSFDKLDAILEQYRPDLLELTAEDLVNFSSIPLPYILALSANGATQTSPSEKPAYYQVQPSSDVPNSAIPVLMSITSTQELAGALSHADVKGVSLVGSKEIKPGLKTYDELADILEALEE